MKNNDEGDYFSKIGKKLDIKYGQVYIKYKQNNKKLFRSYLRQKLDSFLLEEEERNKNKNIFDFLVKQRARIMLEENDDDDSLYDEVIKKKPINLYKYHQLHLQKIERLKTSHFFDEKPRDLVYDPNYDSIKRKIIIGPKWKTMTGRKGENRLIMNHSFVCPKKIKILKSEEEKTTTKNSIKHLILLKKNYSSINMIQKLKKLAKKMNLNKPYIKTKEKEKICKKMLIPNQVKKDTPKTEQTLIYSFPKLYTPKTYLLKESDIKNRYLKNVFLINTSYNTDTTNKKNIIRSKTKILRNNEIGLNYEQIKVIEDLRKNKSNMKQKIKKIKIKKELNKKYKLILTDCRKDSNKKILLFEEDKTSSNNLNDKSFNYLINKSKLENNNKEIIKKSNKTLLLGFQKILKNNEYYNYKIDDLNDHSFYKIDNITFKNNI